MIPAWLPEIKFYGVGGCDAIRPCAWWYFPGESRGGVVGKIIRS